MTPDPFISVAIPTFNSQRDLAAALDSVAAQTFRDFEVVVSDGASADATLVIAERYRAALPRLVVLSRRDKGVYDAINMGTAAARGRWVMVLGSDDRLHQADTLARAADVLRTSRADLVYGDVKVIGPNPMVADGARYGGAFTLARLLGQNICQQAIFYRLDSLRRQGGFDTRFRLWADWDMAQRLFALARHQWMDVVVADYASTGLSSKALDPAFLQTQPQRLRALWLARPFSAAVPLAWLRHRYWRRVEPSTS